MFIYVTVRLFPKKVELQQLMKHYDLDGDGQISYYEFIKGMREPLNERKQKVVDLAYSQLDRFGAGFIKVSEMRVRYDASKHPEVTSGKKRADQITEAFLASFEGYASGQISKAEWNEYYMDLAMTVPSDEYFVKAVEQAWTLAEDEQSTIFVDKVKQIISMMRTRLRVLSNQNEEEYKLRQIFKNFDTNASGNISIEELAAMLAKLGIMVERKYIVAVMRHVDSNQNGMIEFEEFANLLLYDPYK